MKNYGYTKVAAAVPVTRVADCRWNANQHLTLLQRAATQGVDVVVFPELGLTGYTCQDLFQQQLLLAQAEQALSFLMQQSASLHIVAVVGVPVEVNSLLLNCGAVIYRGQLMGLVPKTYLPNYGEFYEKRWFASALQLHPSTITFAGQSVPVTSQPLLFQLPTGAIMGVELCEDLWAPMPPSTALTLAGADVVVNLSASNDLIGKQTYLYSLLAQQSARTLSAYVYASAGQGESTQDVVYGGHALVYDNGRQVAAGQRWSLQPQLATAQVDVERLRVERRANTTWATAQQLHAPSVTVQQLVSPSSTEEGETTTPTHSDFRLECPPSAHPFIPSSEKMGSRCEDIFAIQVMGLVKRLQHTQCKTVVLGISGGLDSTLALLVCARAFDRLNLSRKGIVGVTMPGFGTTKRTHSNAVALMEGLGVTQREVPIAQSVLLHFKDIGHDPHMHDVTYENGQARERTQILMDLANKMGGLVIGTGDLSELALGWATYNGDHISMYNVNVSIPKTLIRHLVKHVANNISDEKTAATLHDIIDTPISPELIPADKNGQIAQRTEDLVGPYELHDFFLYHVLRFGFAPRKVMMLAKAAFQARPTSETECHLPYACYDDQTLLHWLDTFYRRFFSQQFKRSCLPDGPKVGSVSLSPRGDWRMPSDAVADLWRKEVKEMQEALQHR